MRTPSRSWRATLQQVQERQSTAHICIGSTIAIRKRYSEYISLKKARALGLERPPVPRYGDVGSVVSK